MARRRTDRTELGVLSLPSSRSLRHTHTVSNGHTPSFPHSHQLSARPPLLSHSLSILGQFTETTEPSLTPGQTEGRHCVMKDTHPPIHTNTHPCSGFQMFCDTNIYSFCYVSPYPINLSVYSKISVTAGAFWEFWLRKAGT